MVASGASQAFSIDPLACYDVADVKVDGLSVGAVTGYTFTAVTFNHTIDASFAVAPNGTGCNDVNSCTQLDACNNGACAGTPVVPAEVDGGVRLARNGAGADITWNAAACATSSAVLRGLISALPVGPGGGDETCLAGAVPSGTLTWPDGDDPPLGDGFWYLVRGDSSAGYGPLGFQGVNGTPGVPRTTTTCQ